MKEYCIFIDTVKKYRQIGLSNEEAIDKAVDDCIKNGVLADFLSEHRAEVKAVCMTEFDEERFRKVVLEEGIEQGIALGEERGRTEGRLYTLFEMYDEEDITLQKLVEKTGFDEEEVSAKFIEWKANR